VSDGLAAAARSIAQAIAAEPFMIAGTGRFCSRAMAHTGKRALIKGGAEGVMCAALPERGLGIAVKCDDGAQRGAELVMAHLLVAFGAADGDDPQVIDLMTRPMRNAAGILTGEVRAADALLEISSARGAAMIA
jgi:L-asparaginase II